VGEQMVLTWLTTEGTANTLWKHALSYFPPNKTPLVCKLYHSKRWTDKGHGQGHCWAVQVKFSRGKSQSCLPI